MPAMRQAHTHLERQASEVLLATRRPHYLSLRVGIPLPGSAGAVHAEPGTTRASGEQAARTGSPDRIGSGDGLATRRGA